MTADDVLPMGIAAGIGFALNWLAVRNQAASSQAQILASLVEQVKTIFNRLADVEHRQDDHADEQNDIRDAVILQGAHIETALATLTQVAQRIDSYFGASLATAIAPLPSSTAKLKRQSVRRADLGAKYSRRGS